MKKMTIQLKVADKVVSKIAMFGAVCLAFFLSGCVSSPKLTMTADLPPIDNSVMSPKLKEIECTKVMVIPPSGTARGAFEQHMVLFEREFLRQGMGVISSAITGRVVMDSSSVDQEKNETASALSDMERALVMAKTTGADAILQVGSLEWVEEKYSRFFVHEKEAASYREVGLSEYRKIKPKTGLRFKAPSLKFLGKIVDVENGEVLATLEVLLPANYALPEDYVVSVVIMSGGKPKLKQSSEVNFKYAEVGQYKTSYPWLDESMHKSEMKLLTYVAQIISNAVKK